MSIGRDIALVVVAAIGGSIWREHRERRQQEALEKASPQGWPVVPGEQGVVLEPDFAPEEEEDLLEAEANDGYWVRFNGVTLGKVLRWSPKANSMWHGIYWFPDGHPVELAMSSSTVTPEEMAEDIVLLHQENV